MELTTILLVVIGILVVSLLSIVFLMVDLNNDVEMLKGMNKQLRKDKLIGRFE